MLTNCNNLFNFTGTSAFNCDRKDIDDKYKWKIDLMYSSQESIDKDISKIKSSRM